MKNRLYNKISLIIALAMSAFSCSSDLDFNQVDDFNTHPVFTTNLAYFEVKAPEFIINGAEQPFFSNVSNVDFLNTPFVVEDLVKGELYFRVKNTIARAYTFNITFLNVNNAPIHSISINVPAYNGTEILVEKTETFEGANIDILKSTTKMIFSVAMLQGPPLTVDSTGRIELGSSITAYFDVK